MPPCHKLSWGREDYPGAGYPGGAVRQDGRTAVAAEVTTPPSSPGCLAPPLPSGWAGH